VDSFRERRIDIVKQNVNCELYILIVIVYGVRMELELPIQKNEQLAIRLEPELKKRLDDHAKKVGHSASTVARAIIKAFFDEQRRKKQ